MTQIPGGPAAPNVYITEKQFVERFQIPARTLQRWRLTGQGPAFVRFGPRQVRYRMMDVDRWAESRTFAHRAAELSQSAA